MFTCEQVITLNTRMSIMQLRTWIMYWHLVPVLKLHEYETSCLLWIELVEMDRTNLRFKRDWRFAWSQRLKVTQTLERTWWARDVHVMQHAWLKIDPGQCILYASNRLAVHQALYAFQLLRHEFSQFSKQDKYFHDENVLIRQTLIMQCFYNWFLWLPRQTRRLYGF